MNGVKNLSESLFIRSSAACYNTELRGSEYLCFFCCLKYKRWFNHWMCRNRCETVNRLGTEGTVFMTSTGFSTYNTTKIYALVLIFCRDPVGKANEIKQVLFPKMS